ncbi:MAG: adenosylhomocysteine nucleosidase, partial [Clostridiales bacterium]|nr:adenosylhomocysteine nucleosidase [Clostridiales bacterium]
MLGIIGAMDEEVEKLKAQMKNVLIEKKAGMEFYRGLLGEKEAVVVRSGIGKVNAAVCAQILVDDFSVNALINTGIAGSLNKDINIGDIVISSDVAHHDVDAVAFGYPVGQIPRMEVLSFAADQELVSLAKASCETVNPEVSIFVGRVVSGDQFVSSKEKKQWIEETFGGLCTEMEGAAIAQTAYLNQ